MTNLLWIGIGGFLGAVLRYGLSGFCHRVLGAEFPYGTLIVNVAGCLALGYLLTVTEMRSLMSPGLRSALAVGVLGAFTTFSTFGYETLALLRDQGIGSAALNVSLNVAVGLSAVYAGIVLARWGASGGEL